MAETDEGGTEGQIGAADGGKGPDTRGPQDHNLEAGFHAKSNGKK